MTAAKKVSADPKASYKLAAGARRAKVASLAESDDRELRPNRGRIRVALGGKAISRERQPLVFGSSAIDIPEFHHARKKQG